MSRRAPLVLNEAARRANPHLVTDAAPPKKPSTHAGTNKTVSYYDADSGATFDVDFSTVQGTGLGGRITPGDVRAAAGLPRQAAADQPSRSPGRHLASVSAGTPSLRVSVQARWNQNVAMGGGYMVSQKTVVVDVFGPNPLVEELRAAVPENYAAACRAAGQPPTLFTAGDLPAFTTAGFDPTMLLKLPWVARPAAARATSGGASAIFERYGAATEECWQAAQMAFSADDAVMAYVQRVDAFAQAGAHGTREGA